MSAVAALGAIGVATGNALVVAIMIGTVSLLVMVCLALLSARSWIVATPSTLAASGDAGINFTAVLAWCIPLVGASLVLFQVHLPLAAGALNVNLGQTRLPFLEAPFSFFRCARCRAGGLLGSMRLWWQPPVSLRCRFSSAQRTSAGPVGLF